MEQLYYVRLGDHVQGPYSLDQMRALVQCGEVGRSHEVSTDGTSWADAAQFGELSEIFRPSASVSHIAEATLTTGGLYSTDKLAPLFRSMRPWTLFIAMVGLLMCAVQFFQGISHLGTNPILFGVTVVAVVIVALVQGAGALLLLDFALRSGAFLQDRSEERLLAAIGALKTFWVYAGVVTAVLLALLLLGSLPTR